jgi:hypothetical protein
MASEQPNIQKVLCRSPQKETTELPEKMMIIACVEETYLGALDRQIEESIARQCGTVKRLGLGILHVLMDEDGCGKSIKVEIGNGSDFAAIQWRRSCPDRSFPKLPRMVLLERRTWQGASVTGSSTAGNRGTARGLLVAELQTVKKD